MLKTMKQDFITFAKTRPLYLVGSFLYYLLTASMLGLPEGFIIAFVLYAISLLIVFSPLGEKLLRLLERVRKIETKQEKAYLLPIFEDIYTQAKRHSPELGHIELCVIDKIAVNACALGKHTIAVTKGAMETFSEDELKALMAHEIAHILYGDTIAKMYVVIGNGLYSFFVLIIRTFLAVTDFVQALYKRPGSERLIVIALRFIFDLIIFAIMFLMQMIVSINSRSSEYRADRYAYELGYGEKLVQAFYMM